MCVTPCNTTPSKSHGISKCSQPRSASWPLRCPRRDAACATPWSPVPRWSATIASWPLRHRPPSATFVSNIEHRHRHHRHTVHDINRAGRETQRERESAFLHDDRYSIQNIWLSIIRFFSVDEEGEEGSIIIHWLNTNIYKYTYMYICIHYDIYDFTHA